jgi:hypothetical protein
MRSAAVLSMVWASLATSPVSGRAQTRSDTAATSRVHSVPFGVGERGTYEVHFGKLKVGKGTMEVLGIEDVRGRPAWHTRFRIRGWITFFPVDDALESWIDGEVFRSLRFVQDLEEGGKVRERRFEIFPERLTFREGDEAEQPSVADPLDDGAFIYFVRTIPLEVGHTYEFNRYFRPDRNPVKVRVIGRETIRVPAGTFKTIAIQPVIKAKGIFSEQGEARIWLTDDSQRMMVQMKTKTRIGSLNLYLTSNRPTTTTTTATTAAR